MALLTAPQTCTSCNGGGTVQTSILNTVTGQTTNLTESCLACNGRGTR